MSFRFVSIRCVSVGQLLLDRQPLAVQGYQTPKEVQVVNQPIVRGTITIQDPNSRHPNLFSALAQIYRERGYRGLWHGTNASVLKTVPKYVCAIWVKDFMQKALPPLTHAHLASVSAAGEIP